MKYKIQNLLTVLLFVICVISAEVTEQQLNSYKYGKEEFQVLIVGDTGTTSETKEVMELSNFSLLVHLGDYDYEHDPSRYFNKILSSSYKFMGVMGNHEGKSESESDMYRYLEKIKRAMKNSGSDCKYANSDWSWSCKYKNMRVIGVAPGISGSPDTEDHLRFLKSELKSATEDWIFCSWHLYDKYYHTGKYPEDYDENILSDDGESFYDACKEHGAIILSAHDHVYARTRVMSKFKSPEIDRYDSKTSSDIAQIRNGATLSFLNGVGGYEVYEESGKGKHFEHWAKKYAKGSSGENEKKFGGLYCKMNVGGNNKKAKCQFLRINSSNKLFDEVTIYRNENPGSISPSQIDASFKNEKLKAYKASKGIADKPSAQANNTTNKNNNTNTNKNTNTNGNTNTNTNSNTSNNGNKNTNTNGNINGNINGNVNGNISGTNQETQTEVVVEPANLTNNDEINTYENENVMDDAVDGNKENENVEEEEEEEEEEETSINKTAIIVSSSSLVAFAAALALFVTYSKKKKNNIKDELDSFYMENGGKVNNSNLDQKSIYDNYTNYIKSDFYLNMDSKFCPQKVKTNERRNIKDDNCQLDDIYDQSYMSSKSPVSAVPQSQSMFTSPAVLIPDTSKNDDFQNNLEENYNRSFRSYYSNTSSQANQ